MRKSSKLLRIGFLFAVGIATTGCAGLIPQPYVIPDGAQTAAVTIKNTQDYSVIASTYEEVRNCVKRTNIVNRNSPSSEHTFDVEAEKPMALTIAVQSKSGYGHSCHYTLEFEPKSDGHYRISTELDTDTQICRSQIIEEGPQSDATKFKVIDYISHGFSENSAFCQGLSGILVKDPTSLETALYHYSVLQALAYNYSPRRLEKKQ